MSPLEDMSEHKAAVPSKDKPEPPVPVKDTPQQLGTQRKSSKPLTIKTRHRGIKVLVECKDAADEIVADIVAVHGFAVHPDAAWTYEEGDKKVNWLSDKNMLPSACPNARVLTYGYDSMPVGENPARLSIQNIATRLLLGLNDKRKECPRRPIIFVGHCIGGLVALKAYTRAIVHSSDYPNINDSVTGILTLGTPFNGLSVVKGLQKIFEHVAVSRLRSETNLIDCLTYNHDILLSVVYEFTRETGTRPSPPEIFCFFEERATRFGATLGIETELEPAVSQSSGTLHGYQNAGLSLGHYEMDRFEDEEDDSYQAVSCQIKNMIAKSQQILEGRGAEKSLSKSATQQYYAPSQMLPFKEEPNFIDRRGILDQIKTEFKRTWMAVLHGDAGVGKTHIAIKFAHVFHRETPDSKVYWVNASSVDQFELSYKLLAGVLGLKDTGKDALESVRNHLKHDSSGHWLMVLDDVTEGVDLTATTGPHKGASLLEFVPKCHTGNVLITTRSMVVANRLVKHKDRSVIDVIPLDDRQASQLLLGSAVDDAAKLKSAASVAKVLGHCPVALTLAEAYCRNVTKTSLRKYREMITSQPVQAPTPEEAGVRRAWEPLYNRLCKKHPKAARLMLVLGILDVQILLTSFLAEAMGDRDIERHIRVLVQHGLVEPFVNRTAISVSPMIRKATSDWLADHNQKVIYEEEALSLMSVAYPKFESGEYDMCERLHPCVMAILQFAPPSAIAAKRERAILLFKVAKYLLHLGNQQSAAQHLQDCLRLRLEDPQKDQGLIDETQAAIDQATKKAEHHQDSVEENGKNSLPSSTSPLGPMEDTPCLEESYNLALEQSKQGLYHEAEMRFIDSLNTADKHLGTENELTLRIIGNLALVKCSVGSIAEGLRILQDVYAKQEDILGPGHPDTVVTRKNIEYGTKILPS